MVENRDVKQKTFVKPIGEKMVLLIKRIQDKFNKKYGFEPTITETTNMICDAIEVKGIHIIWIKSI